MDVVPQEFLSCLDVSNRVYYQFVDIGVVVCIHVVGAGVVDDGGVHEDCESIVGICPDVVRTPKVGHLEQIFYHLLWVLRTFWVEYIYHCPEVSGDGMKPE